MAGFNQPLDQRAHLGNVFGRPRLYRRRQTTERGDIFVKLPVGCFGDFPDGFVQRQRWIVLRGARVNLIVNVSDVADIRDMLRAVAMP